MVVWCQVGWKVMWYRARLVGGLGLVIVRMIIMLSDRGAFRSIMVSFSVWLSIGDGSSGCFALPISKSMSIPPVSESVLPSFLDWFWFRLLSSRFVRLLSSAAIASSITSCQVFLPPAF